VEPTFTPTIPGTDDATPTTAAGMAVGGRVRVVGTEGSGLSLREGPGPNYARVDVALEGEEFEVVEGPEVAGGIEWWRLRDPDGSRRDWWAAGNYLQPVAGP
jgi:uncharacterized protein YraI